MAGHTLMACIVPTIHVSSPPLSAKHLSPLCPPDTPVNNKGLDRERFEALLQASKERNALVGAKKAVDLRKEIARRAHRTKLGSSFSSPPFQLHSAHLPVP